MVSETVYDGVRGSVRAEARASAFLELKNFEKSVRAYAPRSRSPQYRCTLRPNKGKLPSIAVLPLQNVGGDPKDNYYSDGIVEAVALPLAGLREVFV